MDIANRELLDNLFMEHLTKSVAPLSEMVHFLKPTMQALMGTLNTIKVGDWVEVLYEYAPGICSDGGIGTIRSIDEDGDGNNWCSVAYVLDKRIETGIDLSRITVTIMPYKDTTSANRVQRHREISVENVLPGRIVAKPDKTPLEWLEHGLKSRMHEK